MTTENTEPTTVNENTTEILLGIKKIRKPRSKNKPKTVEKLDLLASNRVDRLNNQREVALKAAAERVNNRYDNKRQEDLDKASARVNARFDDKLAEFMNGLDDAVRPLVTGLNQGVVAVEANETEAAAE